MYCLVCERESEGLIYCERCGFALVETPAGGTSYCTACLREASETEVHFCSECGARLQWMEPAARNERASEWLYLETNHTVNYCIGCGGEIEAARKFCRACADEVAFTAAPAPPVCSQCGTPWQSAWEACAKCGLGWSEQVASALLQVEPIAEPAGSKAEWRQPNGADQAAGPSLVPDQQESYPVLSVGSVLWSSEAPAASADSPRAPARRWSHLCLGCGNPVDLEGADYCQACSLLIIAEDGYEVRYIGAEAEA